jgi:carbonic anhydrase/acetyltransferase-like protein (isoleucine patch superfamily)
MPLYSFDGVLPRIARDAYVHPDAVLIGDVELGPEASVWPGAVLRGDHGLISVGARTSIQDGTVVHTTHEWPTTVGDLSTSYAYYNRHGTEHRTRVPAGQRRQVGPHTIDH